jgi:hypothetical protein
MTTTSEISKLLLYLLLATGLSSCCKKQAVAVLALEFENFDFSNLDSVLLIKTDYENLQIHDDTTIYNLVETHQIMIMINNNAEENGNYILKSTTPAFEHFITEINTNRTTSFGCGGGKIEFSFKLDGMAFRNEKSHTVTLTP